MWRLLLIVFTAVAHAQGRKGPGEAGGGGTTVTINGRTELLDVYIWRKQSKQESPNWGPGYKLPETKALAHLHIDKLVGQNGLDSHNYRLPPVQNALQRLETFVNPSPFLLALKHALETAPIYYMEYKFPPGERLNLQRMNYYIPPEMTEVQRRHANLSTYYFNDTGLHGMIVSKPVFDSLDMFNQTVLVIHEGLRHMQLAWGIPIENKDLQETSVRLALGIIYLPPGVEEYLQGSLGLNKDVQKLNNLSASTKHKNIDNAIIAVNRGGYHGMIPYLKEGMEKLAEKGSFVKP